MEIYGQIKDLDWSLVSSAGDVSNWPARLWPIEKHHQWLGKSGGYGVGYGAPASVGAALANKDLGRFSVSIQSDGDLMFDAGALWVAAKHNIPMLIVMYNNRAYYNDWEHQIRMARLRGTDEAKAHIGMDLFGPEPDFGALARSMGVYGEGPIEDPKDVRAALERAIAVVKSGKPALIDTVTRHR